MSNESNSPVVDPGIALSPWQRTFIESLNEAGARNFILPSRRLGRSALYKFESTAHGASHWKDMWEAGKESEGATAPAPGGVNGAGSATYPCLSQGECADVSEPLPGSLCDVTRKALKPAVSVMMEVYAANPLLRHLLQNTKPSTSIAEKDHMTLSELRPPAAHAKGRWHWVQALPAAEIECWEWEAGQEADSYMSRGWYRSGCDSTLSPMNCGSKWRYLGPAEWRDDLVPYEQHREVAKAAKALMEKNAEQEATILRYQEWVGRQDMEIADLRSEVWRLNEALREKLSAVRPDDNGPKADYHGPRDTSDPSYPAHKAVHDVAEHLLGGRVTNAQARRGLRDALDKADAMKPGGEKCGWVTSSPAVVRGTISDGDWTGDRTMSAARKLPDTAMGQAFAKAKIDMRQPEERLLSVAIDAWAKYPGTHGSIGRRQHIVDALSNEMSYWMVENWDRSVLTMAIGKFLNRAELEIKRQRPIQSTAKAVAPATPSQDEANLLGESRSESAMSVSSPSAGMSAAPNLKILADKQAQRAAASVAMMVKLSRLDTVMIGDRPIGSCTVAEVKAWAEQRQNDMREAGRDARFAMVLVANLPSNVVIRDHWKQLDEVDSIYAKAEAEYAA